MSVDDAADAAEIAVQLQMRRRIRRRTAPALDDFSVKIDDNDVLEVAKAATRDQFAQYGMANVPEDLLENYAKEMLKQEKTREALINRAVDVKLIQAIKAAITLNEEKVSVEEFNKKVSENA
jgi:trigger factor